MVFCI